jgi:hypothetical protein
MWRPEPPDITNQPTRENIERILAYLGWLEDVPGAALDAVQGLLLRAEVAEQRGAKRPEQEENAPQARVSVQMPASQRKAFRRQVRLEQLAITCRNCGKTVIVKHYPGSRPPSACSEVCKMAIARQDNATRQQRFVERQRARKAAPETA